MRNKSQRGYTLIELLVTIGILGVIAPAIGIAIFQVFSVYSLSTNHLTAVKQVENAVYRISRDTEMAQTIQTGGISGFPLNLTWVEWNNTSNNVTYTIQNGVLQRAYSVNGSQSTTTLVARHINIDPGETICQYSNGVLSLNITASLGGFRPASETRVCRIVPRSQ